MAYGINITGGRNKHIRELLSHISSFMFEQEYGEMRSWSEADKKKLVTVKKMLAKHL